MSCKHGYISFAKELKTFGFLSELSLQTLKRVNCTFLVLTAYMSDCLEWSFNFFSRRFITYLMHWAELIVVSNLKPH